MRWKQLPLLLLLSVAGTAAHADTVYNVNLNIGGATATGTITTDGTLGVLATGNVTGFDLTLSQGLISESVVNKNVAINGNQFTATADGLFYDFSNNLTANLAGFGSDFTTTSNVLCFTGGGNCPGSLQQGSVVRLGLNLFTMPQSGVLEVASVPVSPVATPEPSSLALLGTGLLGMYGVARRRFTSL